MSNILDEILNDLTSDGYGEATEAKKSGDSFLALTGDHADKSFLEGIAGHSKHTPMVGGSSMTASLEDWRNRSAGVLKSDDSLMEAFQSLTQVETTDLEKKALSDDDVVCWLKDLLSQGKTHMEITAALDKRAEINLLNRQMSDEYVKNNLGVLGMVYLEPNYYMNSCPKTMERLSIQAGGKRVQARSVKRIKACSNCSKCMQHGKSATCALYKLPIIASGKDAEVIVASIVDSEVTNKRAALVKLANKEDRPGSINTVVGINRKAETCRPLPMSKEAELSQDDLKDKFRKGSSIHALYHDVKKASKNGNTVTTMLRSLIASLKDDGTPVNLNQIDCKYLRGKLAAQNMITGSSKCASCTYRSEMHCGLTGGTLLVFPDMSKQSTNHKTAASSKDGKAALQEYDLVYTQTPNDIDISEPQYAEVILPSSVKVDIE